MIPGLSTIKTWALAALGIIAAVFFGLFQAKRAEVANKDRQDAEAQRDMLTQAEKRRKKAHQEGEKQKDEAIKKTDDGDWSGFNDGL